MRTTAQYFFSGKEFHNRFQEAPPPPFEVVRLSLELVTQILLEVVWQRKSEERWIHNKVIKFVIGQWFRHGN
jgi:hypothetical protein